MACYDKAKTYRREPKRREGMWKELGEALSLAEGVEIGLAQAMAAAELDKKKTRKPTIQRGSGQVGHKPHGQVKPRQQRGTAHGQRVAKQRPDEYPEEWGPHELYQKIGEEAAGIEKLVKAGCPQGQHKHNPYDYCHPSDRKHHGYTDEKPSGPMDAAYGVLDEAIAEAQGMGAGKIAEMLQDVKGKLDPEGRSEQMAQQMLAVADSYADNAAARATSPNMMMRVQAMALKKVADTLRRAAKKLVASAEEKPTTPIPSKQSRSGKLRQVALDMANRAKAEKNPFARQKQWDEAKRRMREAGKLKARGL